MQTSILTKLNLAAVVAAGAVLLPSCTKTAPAPATTVIVQAPAAPAAATGKESDGDIADLRDSDDANAPKSAAKKNIEPTDLDVEDAAPARKAAVKPASAGKNGSDLMWYYDRAPSKYFAAFGGVNRRSLLKRKGAIVDYKHNFIEIPGSANERDGDLHKLQLTLFPNGREPWCAISRIVWPQGNTPGEIGFYNNSADGYGLRQSSDDFFPYKLKRVDGAYESAWLPQRGLDVNINWGQDSEFTGPTFRYNRDYSATKPAFSEIEYDEEGNKVN